MFLSVSEMSDNVWPKHRENAQELGVYAIKKHPRQEHLLAALESPFKVKMP